MSDWKTELEVCKVETERMTEWEQNFIESICDQVDSGKVPSEKQLAIIHRIYDKVV